MRGQACPAYGRAVQSTGGDSVMAFVRNALDAEEAAADDLARLRFCAAA
jgi:hypothetical protein